MAITLIFYLETTALLNRQVGRAQSSYHAANLEEGLVGKHGDPAALLSKHTLGNDCARL